MLAAVGGLGLGLLPMALSQRPEASWIAPWRLDLRLGQIASQYLIGTGAPGRTWLEPARAAAVLLAGVRLEGVVGSDPGPAKGTTPAAGPCSKWRYT